MTFRRPLAVCLLLLAACAKTSGPVEIPPEDLPFSVSRGEIPGGTSTPTQTIVVYLIRDGRLARASRRTATDGLPPGAALRALITGPTSRELAEGISTEVPSSVRLLDLGIEGALAIVDLGGGFQEPASPEKIALRVAQVVWTLTEFPDIDAVRFAIDGEPVAVTTAAQVAVDRPVTRSDYASIGPVPG